MEAPQQPGRAGVDARSRPTIRPMRPDESEEVGAITLAGYDTVARFRGPYREFLADPARRLGRCAAILVAEVEATVAGTVTYVVPDDPEWEGGAVPAGDCAFRVLAVAPAWHGRGIGRSLVEACIDRARSEGRRRMAINSMTSMTAAHRLYTSVGFVRRPDLDVRFPEGTGLGFTLDLTPDAAAHFPPPGPAPTTPPRYEDVWV